MELYESLESIYMILFAIRAILGLCDRGEKLGYQKCPTKF